MADLATGPKLLSLESCDVGTWRQQNVWWPCSCTSVIWITVTPGRVTFFSGNVFFWLTWDLLEGSFQLLPNVKCNCIFCVLSKCTSFSDVMKSNFGTLLWQVVWLFSGALCENGSPVCVAVRWHCEDSSPVCVAVLWHFVWRQFPCLFVLLFYCTLKTVSIFVLLFWGTLSEDSFHVCVAVLGHFVWRQFPCLCVCSLTLCLKTVPLFVSVLWCFVWRQFPCLRVCSLMLCLKTVPLFVCLFSDALSEDSSPVCVSVLWCFVWRWFPYFVYGREKVNTLEFCLKERSVERPPMSHTTGTLTDWLLVNFVDYSMSWRHAYRSSFACWVSFGPTWKCPCSQHGQWSLYF